MSTVTEVAPRVRSWPRRTYRATSTLAAVMLFDQAIFAGQFLAGQYNSLLVHRENATYAGIAVLVAGVGALLYRLFGGGPWWPSVAYLGLFGLVAGQIVLGFTRLLAVHVPLGVLIIGLAATLTVCAWRTR